MEPIVDDAADANNEPVVEVLNDDDITENEYRHYNDPADKVDNQLSIEQPKKKRSNAFLKYITKTNIGIYQPNENVFSSIRKLKNSKMGNSIS